MYIGSSSTVRMGCTGRLGSSTIFRSHMLSGGASRLKVGIDPWLQPAENPREQILNREFVDGRLLLQRSPEERDPVLQRLRRIEGQVRGLQQMLEQDRYCVDELQQINAIQAAMREVSLLIVGQHVSAGLERAVSEGDIEAGVEEIRVVLRALMRQP